MNTITDIRDGLWTRTDLDRIISSEPLWSGTVPEADKTVRTAAMRDFARTALDAIEEGEAESDCECGAWVANGEVIRLEPIN
jgi:hypothetical protein